MDMKLMGRKALVTASTAGIGLAVAESLYAEGATVIVNGRTDERVAEALGRLQGGPGEALGFAADLATPEGAAALLRAHPEVDVLINNLGIYEAKPLAQVEDGDWARLFATNVTSGARLAQAYLPGMTARGWGRLVFVASETGVNVPPDMIPYGVSKAAQIALARGLAETTAGTGVTVNSILPGPTWSEGIERFLDGLDLGGGGADAFLQTLRPTSLLRRFATTAEVAALVTYLASPLAAATNGAAVRVEGGLLRNTL